VIGKQENNDESASDVTISALSSNASEANSQQQQHQQQQQPKKPSVASEYGLLSLPDTHNECNLFVWLFWFVLMRYLFCRSCW
jgi:hypothetical protein